MKTMLIELYETSAKIIIRDLDYHKMYFKTINRDKREAMTEVVKLARQHKVDQLHLDIIGWSGWAFMFLEAETKLDDSWYGNILNFECKKLE
jgi:hypothetical protein